MTNNRFAATKPTLNSSFHWGLVSKAALNIQKTAPEFNQPYVQPVPNTDCCGWYPCWVRTSLSNLALTVRRARLGGLAALLICGAFGCTGPEGDRPSTAPMTIPEGDLSGLESGAREQLREQRAGVDRLLADEASPEPLLAEAYADLGLLYLVYELLEPAGVCFENALRLEPSDVRWPYLLGYLRGRQGNLEEAVDGYRRALELGPDFLPAWLRLGRGQRTGGLPEEARAAFERALEIDPGVAAAHEGLGHLASDGGDYEVAIGHFEQAIAIDPAASGVHYALAQAHRNLGHLDEARAHLVLAGDVATRIPDPLINPLANRAESAQFYLAQGAEAIDDRAYQAAASAFEAALERAPESFAAYRGLAISLERLGDADGARRALETAFEKGTTGQAERDPRERATILRSLGLLEATVGRAQQALGHYLASLELHPAQPDLILRAANALARDGRFDDAITWYDRLIELTPEWTPAVLEKRATALVNLGRRDEAIADFIRAIEAAPEDPRLRLRFAEALEFLGDPAAAKSHRQAAAKLPGDDLRRASMLADDARRLAGRGDLEAAVARFQEVLEITPDDPEARFDLAGILGHLGRFDQAARHFAHVIAAAPRNSTARRGEIVALILGERYGLAREKLQDALRHFPRHAGFAITQAWLLATAPDAGVRNGDLALEIARRVHAERQDSLAREALALAHAAAGQPAEAVALERQLLAEAERDGDSTLAALRRARLAELEAGRAWVLRSPTELLVALNP